MASPQISFTIILQPSVTVEQYQALLSVIQEGASAYQHMIAGVTTNNIEPTVIRIPISVQAEGMTDPDVRDALVAGLDAFVVAHPGITWQFADVST